MCMKLLTQLWYVHTKVKTYLHLSLLSGQVKLYYFMDLNSSCCGKHMVLLMCYASFHSSKEWSTISVGDKTNLLKQTVETSEFWWVGPSETFTVTCNSLFVSFFGQPTLNHKIHCFWSSSPPGCVSMISRGTTLNWRCVTWRPTPSRVMRDIAGRCQWIRAGGWEGALLVAAGTSQVQSAVSLLLF